VDHLKLLPAMITYSFKPSTCCDKLVYRYEIIIHNQSEHIADKHIPNGYAALVFNFAGDINILENPKLPKYFLVPPFLRSVCIESHQNIDSFVVLCKASVLSKLFKIKMFPRQAPNVIPLEPVIFGELWEVLNSNPSPERRKEVFEHFLLNNTNIMYYFPDEIDLAYEEIIFNAWKSRICSLIQSLSIRPRTFRSRFIQRVGVNAKTLARIARVNFLFEKIINHHAVDFQEMVFDCYYFDQPHFIKDFKLITGERPNHFFKRNLDLVKIISGKVD
jgi:hypothetical protein